MDKNKKYTIKKIIYGCLIFLFTAVFFITGTVIMFNIIQFSVEHKMEIAKIGNVHSKSMLDLDKVGNYIKKISSIIYDDKKFFSGFIKGIIILIVSYNGFGVSFGHFMKKNKLEKASVDYKKREAAPEKDINYIGWQNTDKG